METTIAWEEHVGKAFLLCCADYLQDCFKDECVGENHQGQSYYESEHC